MPYSKENLLSDLEKSGFNGNETILIHSSMKSIGEVVGGAETVFQQLEEYFKNGLLCFPALTWDIGWKQDSPTVFSVNDSPCNIGLLPELFRKRAGVIRSMHPSHSVSAKGKDAAEFVKGHEKATTSLPWDSPWGRLYERGAKIFFIGCSLSSNTFLHAVEEKANLPGLMDPNIRHLTIIDRNGNKIPSNIKRHTGEHSHYYDKVEALLTADGACRKTHFGNAKCFILDAKQTADSVWRLLEQEPNFFTEKYQTE